MVLQVLTERLGLVVPQVQVVLQVLTEQVVLLEHQVAQVLQGLAVHRFIR
jgi:hypothetical protein